MKLCGFGNHKSRASGSIIFLFFGSTNLHKFISLDLIFFSLVKDLQILSVVLRAKILDAESNDRNPDKDGTKETLYRYHLVIIDTSLLWRRRNEL